MSTMKNVKIIFTFLLKVDMSAFLLSYIIIWLIELFAFKMVLQSFCKPFTYYEALLMETCDLLSGCDPLEE